MKSWTLPLVPLALPLRGRSHHVAGSVTFAHGAPGVGWRRGAEEEEGAHGCAEDSRCDCAAMRGHGEHCGHVVTLGVVCGAACDWLLWFRHHQLASWL